MARPRKSARLHVFLNSRLVGELNRAPSGAIDFRYSDVWLAWKETFPVSLSLPLREDRYIGPPVTAVFDNLLPDNSAIRRKVAERVGAEGTDAFSLLSALGRDCAGALQFLPDDEQPAPAGKIEGRALSEDEIAAMLNNLSRNPLGLEPGEDFRISIAGAQEKTALLRHRNRWMTPIGSTPTTHILKPQIGELPNGIDLSNSVENEFFCLKLTAALGLPSASAESEMFGGKRVLVVTRFDRLLTGDKRLLRIPQEDCCQALSVPWTRKYESEGGPGIRAILRLLAGSDDPAGDRARFLKTMIVFWLLGATDGHAKNFSVFLLPGGGYRLTPLYDVISAQPSADAKQIRRNQMKLAMAVGKSRHYAVDTIAGRHFIESAELGGVGRQIALDVIDEVIENTEAGLVKVLDELPPGFPTDVSRSISRGVRKRLAQLADERKGLRTGVIRKTA